MSGLWRFAWLLWLSLSLPLQGVAAAGIGLCGPGHLVGVPAVLAADMAAHGGALHAVPHGHASHTVPPAAFAAAPVHVHAHVNGHPHAHPQPPLHDPAQAAPAADSAAADLSLASAMPTQPDDVPASGDVAPAGASSCSACAACAVCTALTAAPVSLQGPLTGAAVHTAVGDSPPPSFLTNGPERPPRSLRA